MRRVFLSCLLVLLLVPGWSREPRLPLARPGPARIVATPVPLDNGDPLADRAGVLRYLGGVHLTSDDDAFGGFSALAVRSDGADDRLTLLGDGGGIAHLRVDAAMRVRGAVLGNLVAGPGEGWEKRDRDAEALAVDATTDRAWVAFERANAVWRYDARLTRAQAQARPQAMRGWSQNSGAESLARDARGRFVVIAESAFAADGSGTAALWFAGDPTLVEPQFRFRLRPPRGWRPVDAAFLPSGDLLILLRRFGWADRGFASRIMHVRRADIAPGATVHGTIVAELRRPRLSDNFEGIAVQRRGGRTIIWLVSDDNQGWPQRTLLLKFAIGGAPGGRARRGVRPRPSPSSPARASGAGPSG